MQCLQSQSVFAFPSSVREGGGDQGAQLRYTNTSIFALEAIGEGGKIGGVDRRQSIFVGGSNPPVYIYPVEINACASPGWGGGVLMARMAVVV